MTTVLLVEHNAADARRVRAMLDAPSPPHADRPSYHLAHVTTLTDALARLATLNPDVVLLDLALPDRPGLAALGDLQAAAPDVPVIALAPAADEALGRQAVDAGAQDCLPRDDLDARLLARSIAYAIERTRLMRELQHQTQLLAAGERQVRTQIDTVADGVIVLDGAGVVRDVTEQRRADEALHESEERYRRIVETASEGILSVSADECITFIDPRLAEMLGYQPDELIGRPVTDLVFDEDLAEHRYHFDLRRQGLAGRFERRFRRKDGSACWVLTSGTPLHDSRGRFAGAMSMYTDITERKQAEQALQRERDIVARIAETSPVGLVTLDRAGAITFANSMAERVLGLTRDDITQRSYNAPDWAITDYAGRPFPDEELPFKRVMATGRPVFDVRHAIQWPDGQRRLLSINTTPLLDQAGQVEGMVAMVQDVTAQVRAEQALRESEERSRSIIESMPLGMHMYRLEEDGRLVFTGANPAATHILGLDHRPLIGKTLEEAFPGNVGTDIPDAYRHVARTGEPWQREEVAYHEGRISGAFEVHAFRTAPGRMTAAFQDVTVRRQAEERIRRANRSLRLLSDCNQAMVHATSEAALLDEMCRLIVEQGGYRMAWVGFAEQDPTRSVRPVAWAGHDAGFLNKIQVSWSEDEPGRQPVGVAIRTGQPSVVRDLAAPEPDAPPWLWLDEALQRGYRSLISLPLRADEHILGALTIYAAGPYAFDEDEVVLLEEMAGDMAFGIVTLHAQAERRGALEALAASEQKYRHLVTHAPAGIYQIDFANRRFTSVNDVMCEYTGYSREEFLALDPFDLLTEESRVAFLQRHQKFLAGEPVSETVEYRVLGKHGREFWVLLNTSPQYDAAGHEIGATVVAHNITERHRAEEELRKREALLQKVLEILPIGLWIADARGQLLIGNPAGVKIWGGRPLVGLEEYRIFRARRLPSGEEIAPDDWALAHTINEGVTVVDELLEINGFDGVKRIILNYTAPVLDDAGAIQGAIVVNQDVTERVKAEEVREKLQAQLLQAQKMEAVGRLTAGVAHDFNNLLTAIMGLSGLLQRKLLPGDPLHEYVDRVLESSQAAANLVQQLMAFSRQQVRQPEVLNVNQLVSGMERMLRRVISEHIILETRLAPDVWCIEADPTQLQQALVNLVVNARDAMSQGGQLTVQTTNIALDAARAADLMGAQPGDYVRLTVRDTGCGMSQEVLSHLFEPFFTTKPPGKGTGLGLATVYGIVQQSRGAIGVESAPEQGAAFSIYLPRVAPAVKPAAPAPSASELPGGSETILLAEDNPGVRALTRQMLTSLGYTVLEAEDGRRALQRAIAHPGPIHLLLTDLVMPEIGGVALVERLRATHPQTRVLFMSGYTDEVAADQGMPEPGTIFVQKPFRLHDVALKVRQVLDAAS